MRLFVCLIAAYAGFYAPILYVNNRATKRKTVDPVRVSRCARPDVDLRRIRYVGGSGFPQVAEEIGAQSADLAEEFVLTNAELSFLQERRQAYENLALRTGLDSVKSVSQALIQAERYGTPGRSRVARACQRKPRHAHERS